MATHVMPSNNTPVANGNSSGHERKPSMNITPTGSTTTQMPNGSSSAPGSNRLSMQFGSMPATDPSSANASGTQIPQHNSLSAPRTDPRITSPTSSPSPIPVPATSGGRPPSTLSSQGSINFGGMTAAEGSVGPQNPPGAPASLMMPGQHFRRASSHSQQSDMGGAAGMSAGQGSARRGDFPPNAGRGGRNSYNFPQNQMAYSPSPSHRSTSGQGRPAPGMPPHFQNQMMGHMPGSSPHMANRTPSMPGSQPHTPHMQHMQVNGQPMAYMPGYNAFAGQLQPQHGQFTGQPGYDPNYPYYNQQGYPMHPPFMHPQAPPSPRFNQMQAGGRPSFGQSQYQQPPSTAMSRTSSAMSERPGSSIGHPASVGTPVPHQPSHTPSQSAASIAPPPSSSNFVRPERKTKAIVIKNADGEVLTFDKKMATTKAPSPALPAASTATPPPRPESSAHQRAESKSTKTKEEIKAEFQASVLLKNQQEEKSAQGDSTVAAKILEEPRAEKDAENVDAGNTKGTEAVPTEPAATEPTVEADPTAKATEGADTTATASEGADSTATASEGADTTVTASEGADATATAIEGAKNQTESDEERKKRLADEEFERMVAEMEAQEKEEEEREKTYAEKKKKEAAEKAEKEKAAAANADEEMKRLEQEAEAAENARQQANPAEAESEEARAERESLFASLKKPTLGPGATGEADSGTQTPASESSPTPQAAKPVSSKPKPAPLKVETGKTVEPPQPTPGMQSLRSARLLRLQNEAANIYPDGIKSPNPALNQGTKRAGHVYDKDFLLQFQPVFKEKPILDWDQKLKDTLGDGSDSAKSARTPSQLGPRGSSRGGPAMGQFGAMGAFAGPQPRTLPRNTTSEQRFAAASGGAPIGGAVGHANFGRPPSFGGPMGQIVRGGGNVGARAQSGRAGSKNESRRGGPSRKEVEASNKTMPLTAGMAVKELEQSSTGWKPTSIGRPAVGANADVGGQMAPDLVQRKVKAALNKMTPERFDKLSDEILRIAAQSKNESDGRTLRQVIALTFEKACDESHWASMYAKFCQRMLSDMTNEVKDDTVRDKTGSPVVGGALFRKYLLNRCQEEFESGWVAQMPEKPEGQTEEAAMLSDAYYAAAAIKRKGLGLVQFIGELYKLQMLSIKIMHECFNRLLNFEGVPDESTIESLVKLIRTVGETMEKSGSNGENLVSMYFERIRTIMDLPALGSRPKFMLLDTLDLRKEGWKTKGDKGPKTIQQIRDEAEAAQQAADLEKARQQQRRPPAGRGDVRGYSNNPMPPPDTRNMVGSDDFKRLRDREKSRQSSGPGLPGGRLGGSSLGPRSASGRLGPPGMLSRASDSGTSSRRDSQKGDKDDDKNKTSLNSFDALANLDDEGKTPVSSPPTTKARPVGEASKTEDSKPADA